MEKHDKLIVPNAKVTMIHVSMDDDLGEAAKWAQKEGFPWPTVLMPQLEASGLWGYGNGAAPYYVLIDKEGAEVAKGEDEVFSKIAALK